MTLIDAYNLQHALGMAPTKGMSLERARLRFVDYLAVELGDRAPDVLLVFDGKKQHAGSEQTHRGLRMRFSQGETADDLIETLILAEARPAAWSVVSNDQRVRQFAARRSCTVLTCGEFIDSFERKSATPGPATVADKPDRGPSDAEMDEWMRAFDG